MKTLFIVLFLVLHAVPFLAHAEDEPFAAEEFGSPTPGQYEKRRGKKATPVEQRELREEDAVELRQASRRVREDNAFYGRELPWWNTRASRHALGFEAPAPSSSSLLGSGAVIFGAWFADAVGMDFYFGLSRTAATATETSTVAENPTAKTRTTTTVFSGANTPTNFTLGAYLKFRAYSNNWFTLHLGPQVALSPSGKSTSTTGTSADSIPNTDDPDNHTVTQTTFGTVATTRATVLGIGPKIGAEFYLKWIPHLGIGMSTGVMAVLGGSTTATTTTSNKTITYTDGVASDPGAVPSTTTTVTTNRGLEATTFGLGGTTFSLVGSFTLRYVF